MRDQLDVEADIGYQRLEQRQVLSASFVASAGGVILDSFDPNQDLLYGQADTNVNGIVQDAYLFILDSGSWTGDDSDPLVELESVNGGTNNRLEVATSLFGTASNALISIDGSTSGSNIDFDQVSSTITFDTLTISNFTNFDRSFRLSTIGDVVAGNIQVLDSNPADGFTPNGDLVIETRGSITINGELENAFANAFDEIELKASGVDNDITIGSRLETASGNILVQSDDAVLFSANGSIVSAGAGDIVINTGLNSLVGDSSSILQMADGATIATNQGVVNLVSQGDVLLGAVSSNAADDAIFVSAEGRISDNTSTETENLLTPNGRVRLFATSEIGSAGNGDIDIEARFLQFDTDAQTTIEDSGLGLHIDSISRSDAGADILSNGFLNISNNVTVGGNSQFSSGDGNDDLLFENNGVVSLNSSVDSVLNFNAGDDIVFDGGRVITSGATHTVNLTADNQGPGDGDRGSISNSAGSTISVNTNVLVANASSGIGDVSQPLRINVDQLSAFNQGPNDIQINEVNSVELVDVITNDGAVVVQAGNDIEATNVQSGETELTEDNTDDVQLTSLGGSINISNLNVADDLWLNARQGSITDNPDGQIGVSGNGQFIAQDLISLADNPNDLLSITGNTSFTAATVEVGRDFESAGNPNFANTFLGTVTLNADTAVLVEDDSTLFQGDSTVENLFVASADRVSNSDNASISATTHAQFNAPIEVVLGNSVADAINIAEIGLFTANAHIELNSSVVINGRIPDQAPVVFGTTASQGTDISDTLYVISSGSVVQNDGLLNVVNIGIEADEHVHLASVSPNNQAIALSAGSASQLTDLSQIAELDAIANIENSEVNATLGQAISIKHQGQLNTTTVTSHLGADLTSGFTSSDGSIFASASGTISLLNDVTADSPTADPQITLYSESGNATDPGIEFVGGVVSVQGPSNLGTVNANQTTATFFDADDEVLSGTTEFLLLNTDGTADQDIVVDYGNLGERGYRVGIVWDRDNLPGQPVEVINTFVSDPTVSTEAFEDTVFQDNPNLFRQIGGNEGGRETFSKVERFSKEAIIAHNDEPRVFSEVTVRNDQDINLFTGALSATTNTLNEVTQILRADLDAPKRFAPDLPTISQINPIEIRAVVDLPVSSSSPVSSTNFTFSRDVQAFESGDLKWVQVQVPLNELEEIEGDVRLKDPTKEYRNAKDAEVNELGDEIGDNEIEEIIKVIETNDKAEAGYWYKVFKDYRNRDDELFFYHFKTGEPQQPDEGSPNDIQSNRELDQSPNILEPRNQPSSLESQSQPAESELETDPTQPEDGLNDRVIEGPDREPNEVESESLFNPFAQYDQLETESLSNLEKSTEEEYSQSIDGNSLRSLSAGSLMAAAMLLNQKTSATQSNPQQKTLEENGAGDFSRLARLKRKIKKLLR